MAKCFKLSMPGERSHDQAWLLDSQLWSDSAWKQADAEFNIAYPALQHATLCSCTVQNDILPCALLTWQARQKIALRKSS